MKVLFVNACVREEESRTLALCQTFLESIKEKEPQLTIKEVEISKEKLKPIDKNLLYLREDLLKKGQWQELLLRYACEFAASDFIIIGAPYWDLSFPALLKVYLEYVSISGLTFRYTEQGSVGLCNAHRMMYISTVGGMVPKPHLGEAYCRDLGQMFGIRQFDSFCLSGLDIEGTDIEAKMREAQNLIWEMGQNFTKK